MNNIRSNKYDVIIIGAGPAGLTAGLYAARAKLKTLIIENKYPGGQIIITEFIENYPGFKEPVSGYELVQNFLEHSLKFGAEQITDEIKEIIPQKDNHKIITSTAEYSAKTIIICSGASPRILNIPGENEFTGRGVSYCATCDAAFFKNKEVAVIGGGDTALEEALFLTKFVSKVRLIHRRDKFRAMKVIVDRVLNNDKIEIIYNSKPVSINGADKVESITIENVLNKDEMTIKIDGVFVFAGYIPNNLLVPEMIAKTEDGYIITDDKLETNISGIFAAGDVREKYLRQVVTACADGATAAFAAMRHIDNY
ncbi:MAG TPA: thioredoxin-disulfide reductase [bacterium]|nr:thioredoxin-disulfide reductase [bacterium]HPN29549.1 thioredoxin-disulfide reductase [bacterium]